MASCHPPPTFVRPELSEILKVLEGDYFTHNLGYPDGGVAKEFKGGDTNDVSLAWSLDEGTIGGIYQDRNANDRYAVNVYDVASVHCSLWHALVKGQTTPVGQ